MHGTPREIWKQAPENQSSLGKKQQEQRAHWPDVGLHTKAAQALQLALAGCRVRVRDPGSGARWVCMHLNSALFLTLT